jgi:DNA-binding response OmpR family regulator
VQIATNVSDALTKLGDQFDWVLLDLMLPDGNGMVVLKKIREMNLKTKVAVMTATGDQTMIQLVMTLNPDHFFSKPIDPDQVTAILTA